jgi:hypothetical protein
LDPRQLALADPAFPFSNIEVILSKRSLKTDRLKLAAEVNGIKLYETITTPVELLQTPRFKYSNGGEATIDPSAGTANLPSRRVEMLNDFQKIEVTAFAGGNTFVPKSAISSCVAGHFTSAIAAHSYGERILSRRNCSAEHWRDRALVPAVRFVELAPTAIVYCVGRAPIVAIPFANG